MSLNQGWLLAPSVHFSYTKGTKKDAGVTTQMRLTKSVLLGTFLGISLGILSMHSSSLSYNTVIKGYFRLGL